MRGTSKRCAMVGNVALLLAWSSCYRYNVYNHSYHHRRQFGRLLSVNMWQIRRVEAGACLCMFCACRMHISAQAPAHVHAVQIESALCVCVCMCMRVCVLFVLCVSESESVFCFSYQR